MSLPLNVGVQRALQGHLWPIGWRQTLAAIVIQSSPDSETPAPGGTSVRFR
jgi:hypothetical protein